jgi:hypothetical protein
MSRTACLVCAALSIFAIFLFSEGGIMDFFDAVFIGGLLLFIGFIACAFYTQRIRWRVRRRLGKKLLGFYPSSASLGNALHTLQVIAEPRVTYVLEEKLDEHEDEDDERGPKDPTAHLKRQLKRIRNGEEVGRLRVPVRFRRIVLGCRESDICSSVREE